jgi:hypothetical protein
VPQSWVPREEGTYQLRGPEIQYWQVCLEAKRDALHDLEEYAAAVGALRADEVIHAQLEKLVGTDLSASRVEVHEVVDHFVWAIARQRGRLEWHEQTFNETFEALMREFDRNSYELEIVAPLHGLGCDPAVDDLQLEDGLVLGALSAEEVGWALTTGLIRPQLAPAGLVQVGRVWGVRARFTAPKVVGESMAGTLDTWERQQASIARMEEVLHALRLFKAGRVSLPGSLSLVKHWSGTSSGVRIVGIGHQEAAWWSRSYALTAAEAAELREFWPSVTLGRSKKLVAAAIRRLSYAGERNRADDRLVDLVIAAESLFLGGAGTAQERGELRYRYALRGAFFLEIEGSSRRQVFRFLRNGYDARSAIVHGGSPEDALLKSLGGDQLELGQFADLTEELVRQAIRKALALPSEAGLGLVDWDALILESRSLD